MLVSVFLIKGEVSHEQDAQKDLEGKEAEEPKDLREEAPQIIG